jgi:hypothetical protein
MVRHRAMQRHDEPGGVLLRVSVRGAASRGGRHAQLASEAPAFAQRHANHHCVLNCWCIALRVCVLLLSWLLVANPCACTGNMEGR